MADTAHRIGPMRRIKVTSRGVQDYYIPEYSYTTFRCGVSSISYAAHGPVSWIVFGEVLRLIRHMFGKQYGASGVTKSDLLR